MARVAEVLSTGHTFLEGPRWHQGDLYVSDFFTERVLKFPGGSASFQEVCRVPGRPSGLGFFVNGDMGVVSMLERRVMRWDGVNLTEHADIGAWLRGPANDMLIDQNDRCWVGNFGHSVATEADFGPTQLVRVLPDGSAAPVGSELNFPNGILTINDGSQLLVAETYAGRVTVFDVDSNGDLSGALPWHSFKPEVDYFDVERAHRELTVEPDGLAIGRGDAIWIADAKGHGIGLYEPDGSLSDFVETDGLSVYSAVVGGANNSTLFLCCAPENRSVDYANLTSSVLMAAEIEPTARTA